MRPDLVAAALRQLADAIEAPANDAVSAEPYSAEALPPGAASWRAVLDAGRRGELTITKIGRRCIVERAEWARYIATKSTRRGPLGVKDTDRDTLKAMGIVVPLRAGGAR